MTDLANLVPSRDILTSVVQRDGKVIMIFSITDDHGDMKRALTDNLMLDPGNAIQAAELLTAMAFEADTSLKPVGATLKPALIERHRDKLIPVIATILRTKINAKESPGRMALAIMDEVCREIFA